MRTALYNGNIYLSRGHFAEALLIDNGKILETGTNEAVLGASKIDERINCQGNSVLPGMNDSHMHLLMIGDNLTKLMLGNYHSIEALIQAGKDWIKTYPERCADGIYARGWNEDLFTSGEHRVLNRHDLDRVSTEIPIVYERVCGHILVTNTKAIEMLALNGTTPQYEGGTYKIGTDGYPDGVFAENACSHPISLIPSQTAAQQRDGLLAAMRYAVSKGITSVQSNDLSYYTRDKAETESIIRDVFISGEALLRYHFQICAETPDLFRSYIKDGIFSKSARSSQDEMLTVGPLKLFKDGSLGARTAMVRKGYHDDPGNFGIETTPAALMDEYCIIAAENDIQVCTHVIGDEAVSETLDSYEKVLVNGKNPLRHSLIHCQITDRPLLERIAELGVFVQYQPIFLNYDLHITNDRVGKELASTSYAFNTLTKLGGSVSYGTDSPVEDCSPFDNIYSAVTRKDLAGKPDGGWNSQECVDLSTAIDAYTSGSAAVQFKEERKGRLKEGYFADIILTDRNVFAVPSDEIKKVRVCRTIVNGKTVYQND